MFRYMRHERGFYRKVIALAMPIILQNIITNTLGIVDTFMVGLLGQTPMAGVTLANVPISVIQVFFFGVQSGAAVLISQFWGKGDRTSINRVIGLSWYGAGIVSISFAAVMLLIPQQFMSLFGNDTAVIAEAVNYGRIVCLSYVLNGFTLVYLGAHRSMANPKVGMYMLAASMCVNTFLNWVLIFGKLGAPAMGVKGAALATLLARVVEFIIMIVHILWNRRFRLNWRLVLRPGTPMLHKMVRYASPVILNETLWGLGHGMYATIIGHMPDSAALLSAYTIAMNIERLCAATAFGLAGATAILVGREIGAGRSHKDVYELGLTLNTLTVVMGAIIGAILLLISRLWMPVYLFPLFHLSRQAAQAAVIMLTVQAVIMPLQNFNSTNVIGVLRGGGDVRAAMVIDVSPLWLVALPAAAVAGLVLDLGILWVYLAMSLEQAVKFFMGVWRMQSGKWINDVTLVN